MQEVGGHMWRLQELRGLGGDAYTGDRGGGGFWWCGSFHAWQRRFQGEVQLVKGEADGLGQKDSDFHSPHAH